MAETKGAGNVPGSSSSESVVCLAAPVGEYWAVCVEEGSGDWVVDALDDVCATAKCHVLVARVTNHAAIARSVLIAKLGDDVFTLERFAETCTAHVGGWGEAGEIAKGRHDVEQRGEFGVNPLRHTGSGEDERHMGALLIERSLLDPTVRTHAFAVV